MDKSELNAVEAVITMLMHADSALENNQVGYARENIKRSLAWLRNVSQQARQKMDGPDLHLNRDALKPTPWQEEVIRLHEEVKEFIASGGGPRVRAFATVKKVDGQMETRELFVDNDETENPDEVHYRSLERDDLDDPDDPQQYFAPDES